MNERKKKQAVDPSAGYVKIERDPNKQAAALRQFFPGSGTNVFKPTAPTSPDAPEKEEP